MRQAFIVFCVVLLSIVSCKKEQLVADRGSVSAQAPSRAVTTGVMEAPSEKKASSEPPPPPPKLGPPLRMIVRTGTLSLIVTSTSESLQALTRQTAQWGGYVSESKEWRENDQLRGSVTLRVPAARFDDVMATVKKSAVRVQSETVTGEDVTQEYSDLGARLRNAEAAEIELRELLTSVRQRTQKAADVLEVYEKLQEVRGEIEQTKGRMLYLGQVTSMSTLTVELVPDVLAQPVVESGWRPSAIAHRAVHALFDSLQGLAGAAIWIAIYLLPIALLFILLGWGAWRIGARMARVARKSA